MHIIAHPLPDLDDASLSERISLPVLWKDPRKLPVFSAVLVCSKLLKHLMFGITFYLLPLRHLKNTVSLLEVYCIFGAWHLDIGLRNSNSTAVQVVLMLQEVLQRHCPRW